MDQVVAEHALDRGPVRFWNIAIDLESLSRSADGLGPAGHGKGTRCHLTLSVRDARTWKHVHSRARNVLSDAMPRIAPWRQLRLCLAHNSS
jgi:hypothetical protein